MDQETPLARAVYIAGGPTELARKITALGREVRQQSISLWLKAGRLPVGRDWAIWIARAIAYQVTPNELDGNAYPHPWDGLPLDRARALVEERVAA